MTAFVTGPPKNRSALRLSWRRMSAEISGGVKVLSPSVMRDFAGLHVFGEAEWKELQFFPDVFDAASHQAFDGVDGALGAFDQGIARGIADDGLVVSIECDHRGKQIQAVVAGNYDRGIPLHKGHQGVGGAEVDADDAIHSHELFIH